MNRYAESDESLSSRYSAHIGLDDLDIPRPFDAGVDPSREQRRKFRFSVIPWVDEPNTFAAEVINNNDGCEAQETEYITGMKLAALVASITTVIFLMMIDTSIISTAIPHITDDFHSLQDVGWYASIYQLASAALQPLTGKVYSKFNVKVSFLVFFAIFELGSLICGTAISSPMLIAGRAIAGMGTAGLMNGGLTIIACSVPLAKRPSLTGIMMGFSQLGVIIGPLVGGALTAYASWRWCFYLNLPIGAVVAVGLLLLPIPDQFQKANPWAVLRSLHLELDLAGFALIAPAAIQLLLALQWGGSKYAWNSPTIIGLFCGAAGTTLAWLLWDWYRGDEALIPPSLFKKRPVWSGAVTHSFLLTNVYCASFYLPLYFQAVHGATPMMSGVNVLASILTQLVTAVLVGGFVERTGYVIPYAILSGMIGAISNGLYSMFSSTTPIAQWVGYQILNGAGRGIGMQMALLAVQAALSPADIAMGMSIVSFMQSLATAIFLAVADTIFEVGLQSELAARVPRADTGAIIDAGATHFRKIVGESDLAGVLAAYSTAIGHVFYAAAGVTGLAAFTSLFLGWKDIRKDKTCGEEVEKRNSPVGEEHHERAVSPRMAV